MAMHITSLCLLARSGHLIVLLQSEHIRSKLGQVSLGQIFTTGKTVWPRLLGAVESRAYRPPLP